MSLSLFFANTVEKEELVDYVASKRFKDGDGNPVAWKIACITADEDENLRKSCMKRVPVNGKKGAYTPELDVNAYMSRLAATCIKYPNLDDAALQDSYKVMGAEHLIKVMLKPGEYQELLRRIQEINGFDISMEDEIAEAKN